MDLTAWICSLPNFTDLFTAANEAQPQLEPQMHPLLLLRLEWQTSINQPEWLLRSVLKSQGGAQLND